MMRSKLTAMAVAVGLLVLVGLNISHSIRISELNSRIAILERETAAVNEYFAEALETQQSQAALQRRVLDERLSDLAARLGIEFEGGRLFPP